VPPNPVARQNARYNGTYAYDAPTVNEVIANR